MYNQEISFQQIIHYLTGSASPYLMNQIESQRIEDREFDEEMNDWEAFVSSCESKPEAFNQLRDLYDQWYQSKAFRAAPEESDEVTPFQDQTIFPSKIIIAVMILIMLFVGVCALVLTI